MTQTETYELLRQIADSWGLLAMSFVFLVLILWPFRPGARGHYEDAATSIFAKDDQEGHEDGQ